MTIKNLRAVFGLANGTAAAGFERPRAGAAPRIAFGLVSLALFAAVFTAAAQGGAANAGAASWIDALIAGFGAGIRRVGEALTHWFFHPLATVRGIYLALENSASTLQEWLKPAGSYAYTWRDDPVSFVAGAATLSVYVAACVFAAWSLERLAERIANALARAVREWDRTVRLGRGGAVTRLRRARAMRLERRRGARAPGMRAILQRLRWWARDGLDSVRLLATQPAAAALFLLERTGFNLLRVTGKAIRAGWRPIAYLALPLALFSLPWIDFDVKQAQAGRNAQRDIAPAVALYLREVADLPIAELRDRTREMRLLYATHRTRLLQPIRELEAELAREFSALEDQVAKKGLRDKTIDNRMDRLLFSYAQRHLQLTEGIFVHPSNQPHDMRAPSRNWLESYADEQTLFEAARVRVTRADAQRHLDEVITVLKAQWSYESCLVRYSPDALLKPPDATNQSGCGESPAYSDASRP